MNPHASPLLRYAFIVLLGLSPAAARAQNAIKADTTSLAATAANWLTADPGSGGVGAAPATSQIGEFDATISANSLANLTLGGANLVLSGLQFDANLNGPAVIGAGNTLAVGASGLVVNTNVTINTAYRSGTVQTWNVAPDTTLTLNGTVLLDESSSSANEDPNFPISGTQVLTLTGGGTVNVPNAVLEPNYTGSGTGIASASGVLFTGGIFNGAGVLIQRSANLGTAYPTIAAPFTPSTTAGFVVNGATAVNLGTLTIGGGFGNNPGSANIVSGATTVTGAVLIGDTAGNSNPQRWGGFEVQGGTFTSLDTNTGFVIAQSDGGVLNPMEVYFAGGVSTIAKMLIGSPLDPPNATNRTAIFIKGGALYLGGQGLAVGNASTNNVPYNGVNGYVVSLYSGLLGAAANWSSSLSLTLSGTSPAFTIETADISGNPHNITLNGVISDGGSGAPLAVTGGGVLTLANTNTFTGVVSINGGLLNAGSPETPGISGPFGVQADTAASAGTLLFGGGSLQYSATNDFDYSSRFDNGTAGNQAISIDTAGQNVTFASPLAGTGTSLTLNDSVGTGSLTLTAPGTYDTGTFVNSGTLNVNNSSGSGTGSGTVTVSGTGVLGGGGTIGGNVVVNSGGTTLPGPGGLTTTITGNLTYNAGAGAVFDLSAAASGPGNDEIVLSGGGSTLNCGNVVTINVTGAGLDLSHNYVLYNVPNGTIAGAFNSVPAFTGTPLLHPNFYSVQQVGSQVLLVVTSVTPPAIGGQTAVPNSIQANQSVTLSATVTPGQYSISSVSVNLSALGLSASQALTNTSGNTWSATVTAADTALPGNDSLGITATDSHNTSTTVTVPLTVTAAAGTTETWTGADQANSLNWSDAGNWQGNLAPGYGDNIYFGGSVTGPVMNGAYSLAGVTFNGGAGSFNLTGSAALTLTGGATNNSSAVQTLSVPVVLNAASVTVNDANGAGVVLGGVISGPTLDSLTTAGNVTLSNANTFAGMTVPAGGTLTLKHSLALQNSTLNNSAGAVSFGTLTTASIGALSGTKNLALENSTPAPVALNIGANNTSQTFSGNLTDTGNGGSLTISGTGTQTLTGGNTYTGGTTISTGSTLIIGTAGKLGGGAYAGAINNAGTFNYNSSASQTLAGAISGTGALNDTGGGTLTLTGTNSYGGLTSISAVSKLTVGGSGQLGAGAYAQNITDNGTLTYNSTAPQTLSGNLSGAGALTDTGTGTLTLSAANPAFSGTTTVGAGATLQLNNSSALQNSVLNYSAGTLAFGNGVTLVTLGGLSGTSSSANLALVDSGNPVTLSIVNAVSHTYAGVLSDGGLGGGLLTGGANQTLTGTNTFTGTTTVLSGSLTVGGAGKLGGGNYPGILSPQTGSTFIWASSAPQILSGPLEGGGSVTLTGTGTLTTVTSNSLSGGGSFSIGTNCTFAIAGGGQMQGSGFGGAYSEGITLNGTLNYSSSNTTTLSGAISGSYGKIIVNAPFNGELSLTGGSSYTNSLTTLTAGILSYSSDAAAGAAPGSAITNIFLNGGDLLGAGSFTLNPNRNLGIGPVTGAVGTNALIDAAGGETFTIGGNLVSAGNTGVIGLVVNSESAGGGTVILAGTNTFTGNITISAGELSLGDPGSLAAGVYAGNITNNAAIFDYSSSLAQTLSGVISDGTNGSGSLSVGAFTPADSAPVGTLTLTGRNTFSGGLMINAGTLTLAGGGLLGAVSAGSGAYAGAIQNQGTLEVNSTGSQSLSGGISGGGALIHDGAGELTLSGDNTYSGATTNDDGTLALVGDGVNTGFLRGTSILSVNAPGIVDPTGLMLDGSLHVGDSGVNEGQQTLSGNGTVLSNVVIGANGTLAPGPVAGYGPLTIGNHLSVGDTNIGGGAIILEIDHLITGATGDSVTARSLSILTNGSTPLPTLTINQGTNDLQTGDTFHLFNITGNSGVATLNRLALTLPATGPVSGVTYVWNTGNLAVNGTLVLTHGAVAVPPLNANPTNLLFQVSGRTLQISWPADHTGWFLQSNAVSLTASNDWFTVPGASATNQWSVPINATGIVFFRLLYQN